MVAGSVNPCGYRQIKIDKHLYRAHRLAWLWMTGAWPIQEQVDHINGIRDDNRWANLRNVSRAANNQNQRRAQSRNLSAQLLGVSRKNAAGGFQARIRHEGKEKRLGTFRAAALAHEAYVAAKRKLHEGNTL
jgi:hypothetical protein